MSENKKYNYDKNYSFSVKLAKNIGLNESIILQHLIFWIEKNKANKKHYYDNYYWTYSTIKAFGLIFPFWSERQILYILKNLEEKKIIKTGNYNKSAYDRTKWYAIIGNSILQKCQMELTKMSNGINENVKPIPYINTDNNIYIYNKTYIISEIITYLNSKTNKNYRVNSQKTKTLINARINEGYKLKDFKKVIDIKISHWLNDEEMNNYLRPETLFSNKFEGYLNQKVKIDKVNQNVDLSELYKQKEQM